MCDGFLLVSPGDCPPWLTRQVTFFLGGVTVPRALATPPKPDAHSKMVNTCTLLDAIAGGFEAFLGHFGVKNDFCPPKSTTPLESGNLENLESEVGGC